MSAYGEAIVADMVGGGAPEEVAELFAGDMERIFQSTFEGYVSAAAKTAAEDVRVGYFKTHVAESDVAEEEAAYVAAAITLASHQEERFKLFSVFRDTAKSRLINVPEHLKDPVHRFIRLEAICDSYAGRDTDELANSGDLIQQSIAAARRALEENAEMRELEHGLIACDDADKKLREAKNLNEKLRAFSAGATAIRAINLRVLFLAGVLDEFKTTDERAQVMGLAENIFTSEEEREWLRKLGARFLAAEAHSGEQPPAAN